MQLLLCELCLMMYVCCCRTPTDLEEKEDGDKTRKERALHAMKVFKGVEVHRCTLEEQEEYFKRGEVLSTLSLWKK